MVMVSAQLYYRARIISESMDRWTVGVVARIIMANRSSVLS